MNTFLQISGAVTSFLFFLVLAASAVSFAVILIAKLLDRHDDLVRADEAKAIGQSLQHQSYWFTESSPAYIALNLAGQHIAEFKTFTASSVREAWQKELVKASEKVN